MNRKFCYTLTMVVSLFAASANGAPMAYSINSDSNTDDADSLYLIDLATGSNQQRGTSLFSGSFYSNDVEGLAFAPNSALWGIDDGFISDTAIPTLFPIDTATGTGNFLQFVSFGSLPSGGHNDFGMTFACDGSLYVTSVSSHTLYELGLDGSVENIGDLGSNVNISAIAAIGNPTRLYGLGNGLDDSGATDSPNLYSINTQTGLATVIGALGMGVAVDPYNEGGLAFASDGSLWAITDRSKTAQTSQILSINVITGAASHVSYTSELGFESLAIAPPTECQVDSPGGPDDQYPHIPTLDSVGRLLSIFALMFAGMIFLRRRIS